MNFNESNPIKAYKRISIGFIVLTVILLVFVVYMALSRATIVVQPKEETVKADLLVTVKEFNLTGNDVFGRFATTTVSGEGAYVSTKEIEQVPGVAEGTVIIYNKANSSQILIPTTRLLSEDDVLFRLKNKVVVPAGGSVVAEVYADKEGGEGNLAPTSFTIPGLSADLQKKIYAVSKERMSGGLVNASAISELDEDDAIAKLKETLTLQVSDELRKSLNVDGEFADMVYFTKVVSEKVDASVGSSKEFKLYMTLDVTGVAYSDGLKKEAEATLKSMVSADKTLVGSNIEDLKPVVETYDPVNGSANLKVDLVGKTIFNQDSDILDKAKLAGKSKAEVQDYLSKFPGIESVEIKFFPFWLKSVPKLRDHIKVIVK